ncbi:MAG: tyrosine-type recombinase/integrase [Bryobacterales bacterium]|nr:tyrosine-type recombinase/integrase [Bryobacterales bacterium]
METLPVPITQPSPDAIARLKALLLDSVSSPESKRAYGRAVEDFLNWYRRDSSGTGFTKATVQGYRTHLLSMGQSASTVNVRMSAIRRLAAEAADNGLMAPDLASGIGRVKGVKRDGIRTGNWLTVRQAEELVNVPNVETLKGKRDRALLAVLIGCGLRREETATLSQDHIQQRDGRWVIVDMQGKGGRLRTVPMPSWCKAAIDMWTTAAHLTGGRVFRPVNKGDRLSGDSMTAQSIFETVKKYGTEIGLGDIAPHDLRRTFAKLAHRGRAALEQIQLSLGHSSVQTTERYLGIRQDLTDAPCDRLGLNLHSFGA